MLRRATLAGCIAWRGPRMAPAGTGELRADSFAIVTPSETDATICREKLDTTLRPTGVERMTPKILGSQPNSICNTYPITGTISCGMPGEGRRRPYWRFRFSLDGIEIHRSLHNSAVGRHFPRDGMYS